MSPASLLAIGSLTKNNISPDVLKQSLPKISPDDPSRVVKGPTSTEVPKVLKLHRVQLTIHEQNDSQYTTELFKISHIIIETKATYFLQLDVDLFNVVCK